MTRGGKRPPATPATRVLEAEGVGWTGHVYEHRPSAASFGLQAADALGVSRDRVFKTLVAEADGGLAVAVVPVDAPLDLGALARSIGAKRAIMADPALAERRTGYVLGGISPLGQRNTHPTVVDASAERFETIFVSGGRRGFEIEITPRDLARVTGAIVAPVSAH